MSSEEDITKYIYNNLRETPLLAQNCIAPQGKLLPHRNPYVQIKKYVDDFLIENRSASKPIERWLILLE